MRRDARLAHRLGDGQHDQLAEPAFPIVRVHHQRAQASVATAHGPRQQVAAVPAEHAQAHVQPDRVPEIRLGIDVAVRPQRVDEVDVVHVQLTDPNVRRHPAQRKGEASVSVRFSGVFGGGLRSPKTRKKFQEN